MTEKQKKILGIAAFIGATFIFAFLLYWLFFKKAPKPTEVVEQPTEGVGVLPGVGVGAPRQPVVPGEKVLPEVGVKPIVPAEVQRQIDQDIARVESYADIADGGKTWTNPVAAVPTKGAKGIIGSNNARYYNAADCLFYEVTPDGQATALSQKKFCGVDALTWNPTKKAAIVEFPDGFKVYYDFEKDRQYNLPRHWEDFSFDAQGSQIAAKSTSPYPENNWLITARPDGTAVKPIEPMGENADKVEVSWSPNNQSIAFSFTGDPRAAWEQEMLVIGKNQENFKSVIVDGRGFEHQWSPKGDAILYSVHNSQNLYKPRLYFVKAEGDSIGSDKRFFVETWAHKCAWDPKSVIAYCAVPREIQPGGGIIKELGEDTQDDFYRINTRTGAMEFLAETVPGPYNVESAFTSADGSLLYFTDKDTGFLKYIKLK